MNSWKRWSAVAALCVLAVPLWAEPAVDAASAESEVTVVVTGERVEQPISESIASITVITAAQMRERGAVTVADALRDVPGMSIRQSGQVGALAVAAVRGSDPGQVLVLVDGQRISSPAFIGGTDLSTFTVDDIDRVEVIRGPASSVYGSQAIGGVINIITKRHAGEGGSVTVGYGSNGRVTRRLALHGAAGEARWQLSGDFPAFDGDRPNSAYEASEGRGAVQLPRLGGWDVALTADTLHNTLGLPGADYGDTGYFAPEDTQSFKRVTYGLHATRPTARGTWAWNVSVAQQRLTNEFHYLDWMTSAPVTALSEIDGNTLTADISHRRQYGAHDLLVGGEYGRDSYKDHEWTNGTLGTTQNKSATSLALFAQDRWGVTPSTDLVLAGRLDDFSRGGSRVTPRIGVHQHLGDAVTVRASYAEGFRAPSLVERYYNSPFGTGNPDLDPELSHQYEVGVNWGRGRNVLDLAAFTNHVRNQITWTGITYENVRRARQRGAELSWQYRMSRASTIGLAYTYLDAVNTQTGERLLRLPHHQVSVTATHRAGAWDLSLAGRWLDTRPDIGGYDPITYAPVVVMLPARASWDLGVTYRGLGAVQPYLFVRNLTDERNIELAGYPVEGRAVEGGVRAQW